MMPSLSLAALSTHHLLHNISTPIRPQHTQIFTRWANQKLMSRHLPTIEDVLTDIGKGDNLANLLFALSEKEQAKPKNPPKLIIMAQKIEHVGKALDFVYSCGVDMKMKPSPGAPPFRRSTNQPIHSSAMNPQTSAPCELIDAIFCCATRSPPLPCLDRDRYCLSPLLLSRPPLTAPIPSLPSPTHQTMSSRVTSETSCR